MSSPSRVLAKAASSSSLALPAVRGRYELPIVWLERLRMREARVPRRIEKLAMPASSELAEVRRTGTRLAGDVIVKTRDIKAEISDSVHAG